MKKEKIKTILKKVICCIVIIPIVCVFGSKYILLLLGALILPLFPSYVPSEHAEFATQYTEEEHIERLTQIVDYYIEKYWWRTGSEVTERKIEILYSFYDGDPEYFMITYKVDPYIKYTNTPYGNNFYRCPETLSRRSTYFELGTIIYDNYKLIPIAGTHRTASMQWGNIFEVLGYENSKKYYGNNCFGVENENGDVELIYEYGVCEFTGEMLEKAPENNVESSYYYHLHNAGENGCNKCFNKRVLTTEEQKPYMKWGCLDINLIDM